MRVEYYDRDDIKSTTKSNNTPVTEADTKTETFLREGFLRLFPSAAFIGEETEGESGDWRALPILHREDGLFVPDCERQVIVMDPLDGTINFKMGKASRKPFAIMVALFEKGKTQAVWIYYPLIREFLFATKDVATCRIRISENGSFGEPEKIFLQEQSDKLALQFSIVGLHTDHDRHMAKARDIFHEALPFFGALEEVFCVAESLYDLLVVGRVGAWSVPNYSTPWDIWTTGFLLERAGGVMVTADGKNYKSCDATGHVAARTPELAMKVCSALSESGFVSA
ncbi:MAG: inositol monophosphatase family protein [Alphaproteobacteria bacterium]|nr:inositol monophosphatase family protein [Alphaproteobacteria bacterium]